MAHARWDLTRKRGAGGCCTTVRFLYSSKIPNLMAFDRLIVVSSRGTPWSWRLIPDHYDDGGLSGASLDRPALQSLLADVRAGRINIVVVYKVDRLTRSLADFAKLVELFDQHGASFVSVTQSFNTTTSMGRLALNVLLSFAQFEREVIGERVRDKIAASKRKGIWVGGPVPLGYRTEA